MKDVDDDAMYYLDVSLEVPFEGVNDDGTAAYDYDYEPLYSCLVQGCDIEREMADAADDYGSQHLSFSYTPVEHELGHTVGADEVDVGAGTSRADPDYVDDDFVDDNDFSENWDESCAPSLG